MRVRRVKATTMSNTKGQADVSHSVNLTSVVMYFRVSLTSRMSFNQPESQTACEGHAAVPSTFLATQNAAVYSCLSSDRGFVV